MADGQQVAVFETGQQHIVRQYVSRFADRPCHNGFEEGLCCLAVRPDRMAGVIKSRPHEIIHGGIDDDDAL